MLKRKPEQLKHWHYSKEEKAQSVAKKIYADTKCRTAWIPNLPLSPRVCVYFGNGCSIEVSISQHLVWSSWFGFEIYTQEQFDEKFEVDDEVSAGG